MPEKFRIEKGLFFGVNLIQAVVSKTLRLFSKIIFFLQNIRTLKISLLTLLRAEINGGGGIISPSFEG